MSIFGSSFGATFGAIFGAVGDFVTPIDVTIAPEELTGIAAAAVDRLLEQFKDRPNIIAMVTTLTAPMVEHDTALQQLLTLRNVDTATGVTLDKIGKIVGQGRQSLLDDDYRHYVRTRIARNRSKGRVSDLIKVSRLALSDITPLTVQIDQQGAAAVVVRTLLAVLPAGRRAILIAFLRQTVAAGVYIILETLGALEAESFSLARATFCNGGAPITSTTLTVDSTARFPTTGTLIIDMGLAAKETVAYNGVTLTSFLLTSGLVNNHVTRSCVQLSNGPGKGLGTTTNAALGGVFASAIA